MTQQSQTIKGKPAPKKTKEAIGKVTEGFIPNEEEMHDLISKEAYLIAEQRGFEGDKQLEDWKEAETVIASRFSHKH